MLEMFEKATDYTHDIAYYVKDSRLTEPSDGKRYEFKEMIEIATNKTFAENYAKSIMQMQNSAGTGMTHVLQYPFMTITWN